MHPSVRIISPNPPFKVVGDMVRVVETSWRDNPKVLRDFTRVVEQKSNLKSDGEEKGSPQ